MKIKLLGHLTTLYMVLRCSTHDSLKQFGCNWSEKGKGTNSSLDAITEQTIFNFQ